VLPVCCETLIEAMNRHSTLVLSCSIGDSIIQKRDALKVMPKWATILAPSLEGLPLYLLERAKNKFSETVNEYLSRYKIDYRDVWVMLLADDNKLNQKNIADTLKININSMVAIVDHLQNLKYIQRVRDKNNRRVNILTITSKGAEVLKKIREDLARMTSEGMKPLTDDQIDTLMHLLRTYISK
jgi:DNA-binding MarR family transcriptional regulator